MASAKTSTPKDPSKIPLTNAACYAVRGKAIEVGSVTPTLIQYASDSLRNVVTIQNLSAGAVYIGGPDVTTATGTRITNGLINALDFYSQCELWAISDTPGQDVRILEAI